jgi:H+/gluconate symporter-like permease
VGWTKFNRAAKVAPTATSHSVSDPRRTTPVAATKPETANRILLHRIAVMSAGTLDSLPQNGAVVTLLAVCGSTHRESYLDIVMAAIVGPILGLAAVIALGSWVGSF